MNPIFVAKVKIDKEEKEAVIGVLDSGLLAQGAKVGDFEKRFADYCGIKHAVAVNSGTAALHTACHVLGIGPGDEVITTPFTFVATANPILMTGAKVIFTDVKSDTYNLDPLELEKKITPKTKAIIPVDLYGQPYDYRAVKKLAQKHSLLIIEDACQAVGADLAGKKTGALGDIGCFSFYATKNMMTGEGGMLTTNNKLLSEKAKQFRHHGQSEQKRYTYSDLGYNYRMTDISAAIGLSQLKKIDILNNKRIANAEFLADGIRGIKGLITPFAKSDCRHVFHQFTLRITKDFKVSRDQFLQILKEKKIFCGIYYPKPLHLQPYFKKIGYKRGDFPVAEKASREVVSLPVHPYLRKEELNYIIKAIKSI